MAYLFKKARLGACVLISLSFLFTSSARATGNSTTEMPFVDSSGQMDPTVVQYFAVLGGLASAWALKQVKDVVSEKDFAKNLGIKLVEFWKGATSAIRKPDRIEGLLSEQMTNRMRRVLKAAMNHGLKKQPLDGDATHKFIPGYFDPEGGYFVWQNMFPSSLKEGEEKPGLVIYIPADEDDSIPERDLRPLSCKDDDMVREHSLAEQLLGRLLPEEKDQEPLLKRAIGRLNKWFRSGTIRSSFYLEGEPVREGVKILRILNPTTTTPQGVDVDLLGTLIFMPDLDPEKVDLMAPILIKPEGIGNSAWRTGLPKRVKWFLKHRKKHFSRGASHASLRGGFFGPILNENPEEKRRLQAEEKRRREQAQEEELLRAQHKREMVFLQREHEEELLRAQQDALKRLKTVREKRKQSLFSQGASLSPRQQYTSSGSQVSPRQRGFSTSSESPEEREQDAFSFQQDKQEIDRKLQVLREQGEREEQSHRSHASFAQKAQESDYGEGEKRYHAQRTLSVLHEQEEELQPEQDAVRMYVRMPEERQVRTVQQALGIPRRTHSSLHPARSMPNLVEGESDSPNSIDFVFSGEGFPPASFSEGDEELEREIRELEQEVERRESQMIGLGDLERGSLDMSYTDGGLAGQNYQSFRMMSPWPPAKRVLTARDVIERGCYSDDEDDDDLTDADTEKDHSVVHMGEGDEKEHDTITTVTQFLERQGHEEESDADDRHQDHEVIPLSVQRTQAEEGDGERMPKTNYSIV